MDTLAELAVKITTDTKGLTEGLGNVEKKLSSFAPTAKKIGVGIGIGTVAAVGAGLAAATSFAGTADELEEMSQRTGIGTTALQELQYAAKLTGSDLSGLEGGVKKMQNAISDGSPELEKLGINLTSLQGLSVEEQLAAVADIIAGIEDPTMRANVAMAIMGKSGTDLIPMLAGGKAGLKEYADEAHNANVIMSEESVKAGAEFQDGLDKLTFAIGGVVNQIGAALIPVITPLIPLFEELIKTLPLEEFTKLLKDLLPPIVELFSKLMKAIPLDIVIKFVSAALVPLLHILEAILPVLEPILYLVGQLLQLLTPVLDVLGQVLSFVFRILGSGITSVLSEVAGLFGGERVSFNMPSFASGGIVPGTGPQLIMAHGGEGVLTPDMMASMGGNINLYIDGEQVSNVVEKRLYDRLRYQEIPSYL
ncbi:MAG: hypothetical protein PHI12_08910 [Dehalococcoidales bacterium]|nr:hypothetical protein [Dehalococcoidales bacterium]